MGKTCKTLCLFLPSDFYINIYIYTFTFLSLNGEDINYFFVAVR